MSRPVRLRRRVVWLSAVTPALGLGTAVLFFVLSPQDPVARRSSRVGSEHAATARERDVGSSEPNSTAVAPLQTSVDSTVQHPRLEASLMVLRSSLSNVGEKRAALRLVASLDRTAAAKAVVELLEGQADASLEADALRVLASTSAEAAALRPDLGRLVLEAVRSAKAPEVALAGGAALDALPAGTLHPEDLVRACETAALPEARVAVLRSLATSGVDATGTIEAALKNDPAPVVRAEAFALLAAQRQAEAIVAVRNNVVGDPAVRAVAARWLASIPGAEIDQVLVEAFLAEQDPLSQKNLATTLANRFVAWPTVAMSESQVRVLRAAGETRRSQ